MSVIRIHKQRGEFTLLPKEAVNDCALTWEARGMLAYLLDKPDNWQVMFTDLVKQSPAGRDQTRRILHHLEDAGYIVRRQVRYADGTFGWESEVHETPQPLAVVQTVQIEHDMPVQPSTGNQYMVQPSTGNPATVEPSTVNQQIQQELSEQELSSESSSSGEPTLADLWRIFSERFSETFGHMPPFTMSPDGEGAFAALVKGGLTLAQIDQGVSHSLETFKPSGINRYPNSWRYCLAAMDRALHPAPRPASNGHAPAGPPPRDPTRPTWTHLDRERSFVAMMEQEGADRGQLTLLPA